MKLMCKCEGCDREAAIVGTQMCQRHHRNMRVHGTPEAPIRQRTPQADLARVALARGMANAVEVGDCLEWQGQFSCKGKTPVVKARDDATNRTENLSVPRLLWERDHGPIPEGKLVYRRCCNNACVIDGHLRCGTRKDWAAARKRAGTNKHSPVAKLHLTLAARRRADVTGSMEKAREVRSLKAAGLRIADIAAATGVNPYMVEDIARGKSWRELGASPFAGLGMRALEATEA